MCFSKEVSLATFITGITGSIFVYTLGKLNDKIIGIYLGYVSLMQGIEYLLWNHQTCDVFHKDISFLGMILNISQPIVLGIIILLINTELKDKSLIIAILFIYSIFAIEYCKNYSNNLQCTRPRPNDPHLVWNWTILESYTTMWAIYIITVCSICIIGMPTLDNGIRCAFAAFITMLISIIIYPRQDMGAMWCFFTALSPPFYYIARRLKIFNI